MATRDRTEEFLRRRPAKVNNSADAHSALVNMTAVKPLWVTEMDKVRDLQQGIGRKMKELQAAQREKLKVRFTSVKNETNEDDKIETLTREINQGFREAEKMLETVKAVFTSEFEDDDGTETEKVILNNVQRCLANAISAQLRAFGDSQGRFNKELQQQKATAKKGEDEKRSAIREKMERDAMLVQYRMQGFTEEQIEQRLYMERDADERRNELLAIQTGFMEVSDMIQDLHTLVIEQGTVLDRIDANMTAASRHVKKGTQELKKAAKHQQAGCFKLLVLMMIILIIGFILAIAAKAVA